MPTFEDHRITITVEQAEIICAWCFSELNEIINQAKKDQSVPNYSRLEQVQKLYDTTRKARRKIKNLAHA